MYKTLLIIRYLRKRRIAWVSLIAVTLCTAMVLVVISVMGGWLRMFRDSFHGLTGDIIVQGRSSTGFPYYQEMADRISGVKGVTAVVPEIDAYGLLNVQDIREGVSIKGYPATQIGKVNKWPQSLYRQYQELLDEADDKSNGLNDQQRAEMRKKAAAVSSADVFAKPLDAQSYRDLVPKAKSDASQWPGMIVATGVVGFRKGENGAIIRNVDLSDFYARLTVLPISPTASAIDFKPVPRNYWLVDDSHTKIWEVDETTVYVPFDILQKDLQMDASQAVSARTGKTITIPARTSQLNVAVVPGANVPDIVAQINRIVEDVVAENKIASDFPIEVQTWEESKSTYLHAIEREKALVTVLFSLISVVAVFLIFCIFYMIVAEKTKDIGVIKSVGATNAGVAQIFLGYGLAIGLVGGFCGLLVGYLVVHNINYLHAEMGKLLGIQIWTAETYAFDTIPNTMNPHEVAVIVAVAVISSVLGALVPAMRAAWMHPVEALRWE
jgi:lipoprotein-releasing system permease protein